MTRLSLLAPDALNLAQRKIYDAITRGPRSQNTPRGTGISLNTPGGLPGPFNAWMYSPAIGNHVQELGAALRFSNSLPENLLEIAVLMVGRHWLSQFEFWAHARLAKLAGVSDAVIEAIRTGAEPAFDKPDEKQIYLFANEMLTTRRVSDTTYEATRAIIGENGLVDLIALMGYYTIVSMTLNCFHVALPDGQQNPFAEPAL